MELYCHYSFGQYLLYRAQSIFTITVEQKERQSSKVGVRARLQLADLAGIVFDVDVNVLHI